MLTIIVGGFFGDEGKGKIAAYLALKDRPEIAVRTGSVNAGHTVIYGGRAWKLRVVPSAFVSKGTKLMLPAGYLLNPEVMWRELRGTGVEERFFIDRNAGIIEEKHIQYERENRHLREEIGSTLQGVGAAMSDRVLRKLKLAKDMPGLSNMLTDVSEEIHETLSAGGDVLAEGSQGTFLSLLHGTYPYVTSRDTTASAVASEIGVGPKQVDEVILVFKAYVTRVGGGPLKNELSGEEAERRGWSEKATVTERARRAAPFDEDLALKAVKLNSATQIAITKIDVLFPEARGVTEWGELPQDAKEWILRIENFLKRPVTLIGTGPTPQETVDRRRELGIAD